MATAPRRSSEGRPVRAKNAVVVLLDSLNRHMLGAYGGASSTRPTSTASPPGPCASIALHRFPALHAGAPRHPLRRPRLPLETLGLHRALGRTDHRTAAPRRRHHHARLRSPAPVRDRRRELPHGVHAAGTTSAATRAIPGRPAPTPPGSATPALPAGRAPGLPGSEGGRPYDDARTWFREELDFPGPAHHGEGRGLAARQASVSTTASCCSWTSSIPHEPFDTPHALGRNATTRTGTVNCIIWPPYAVDAVAKGRLSRRAHGKPSALPTTAPSCR
jgi:hypothetical protein